MTKRTFWLSLAGIGIALIILGMVRNNQSLTAGVSAVETPEAAAQRELPQLIKIIQGDAVGFGFKDAQEVESITLGHPHQIYQPNYSNVENYRSDMRRSDLFVPTNQWQFAVLHNGQVKGLTLLVEENGRFQFIGFGAYVHLAQSLVDFQARHEQSGFSSPVPIVAFGPLHSNFALVEQRGRPELSLLSHVPPGKQRSYLDDVEPGRPHEMKDIMPKILRDLAKAKQALPRN
jgi:hypothetical protein